MYIFRNFYIFQIHINGNSLNPYMSTHTMKAFKTENGNYYKIFNWNKHTHTQLDKHICVCVCCEKMVRFLCVNNFESMVFVVENYSNWSFNFDGNSLFVLLSVCVCVYFIIFVLMVFLFHIVLALIIKRIHFEIIN